MAGLESRCLQVHRFPSNSQTEREPKTLNIAFRIGFQIRPNSLCYLNTVRCEYSDKGYSRRPSERTATPIATKPSAVSRNSDELPPEVSKEAHKYFDQAIISVQSGNGGNGAILKFDNKAPPKKAQNKKERAYQKAKQKAERGGPKRDAEGQIYLPVGGHGGDVIVYADEFTDTLLEFHKTKKFVAKRGGNVNSIDGLGRQASDGTNGTIVRIPVPVGTVVKKKRGGKLLADLCHPGDEILVARGGRGGISILSRPDSAKTGLKPANVPEGVSVIHGPNEKEMITGLPGEEASLELTLRVVADVGLVGLPNAGKSSLLSCVTSARPQIAAYPFTTLMPNLGRLQPTVEPLSVREGEGATFADLPGLIQGAHLGKGLGRMFLRHLRRTRVLLHLLDASTEDPFGDYLCLREELWLYNEEYTERPHIVVLNKIDLPAASERVESLKELLLNPTMGLSKEAAAGSGGADVTGSEKTVSKKEERGRKLPVAVVAISAKEGLGMDGLLEAVRDALANDASTSMDDLENESARQRRNHFNSLQKPQWQL